MEDKSLELLTKLYIEMKEQFAAVNGRIDAMEETVNSRIDVMEETVNSRIDTMEETVNSRIGAMEETINSRIDAVEETVNSRIDAVEETVNSRIDALQNEVKILGNQVARLENDLKPKIEAALDGYKQHTDILERIEKEVSRQDEIIMRRIR